MHGRFLIDYLTQALISNDIHSVHNVIAAERQRSSSLIWKFYSTQSFRVSI